MVVVLLKKPVVKTQLISRCLSICMLLVLLLLLIPCHATLNPSDTTVSMSVEFQRQIDTLIKRDTQNKKWSRVYLEEIDQVIIHDDIPAYVFFVQEFEKVPREIVPEWLRREPGYTQPISDIELTSRLRWWRQAIKIYLKQHQL